MKVRTTPSSAGSPAWQASLSGTSASAARSCPGELRNLALNAAHGEFVATWDDDDLYHPRRLSCQMAALKAAQADACCLGRLFIWWQDRDRLAISHLRAWENSLLARKNNFLQYQPVSHGSDTAVVEQIIERGRLVLLDYPELYLYVYHGSNVWGAGHWQNFWSEAALRLTGEKSQQMLRMLGAELQVELQPAEPPVELSSPSSPLEILPPPSQPAGEIPHILHQTWKDENLPEQLRLWRRSWLEKHPDWTSHLWTDTDLRQLIQRHYAWFLPIYDHYPEQIMRVDAARCFILHYYGGVYADLDVECLRPIDALLEGKHLVLGLEPEAHLQQDIVIQSGLKQIISNALMASQPGDPFWQHAFLELVASHRQAGPLDAAGPFFLNSRRRKLPGAGFDLAGACRLALPNRQQDFLGPPAGERAPAPGANGFHRSPSHGFLAAFIDRDKWEPGVHRIVPA